MLKILIFIHFSDHPFYAGYRHVCEIAGNFFLPFFCFIAECLINHEIIKSNVIKRLRIVTNSLQISAHIRLLPDIDSAAGFLSI